jgi:propionyl-CoA synthetase
MISGRDVNWADAITAVSPVAAFKNALVVQRLPRTQSGKLLRATMKLIADKQPYKLPATIEDPVVLEEIKDKLQKRFT